MTTFESLGVSASIMLALEDLSFTTPTEIQAATIPALNAGEDIIGVAQTGSGKTAAFVIPVLDKMVRHIERAKPAMPRALILAPTRELAIQITDKIKELGKHMRTSCCTIYGGVPYRTQNHILRRGVDILVATPGRLMDHMKQGNIYLDEVEYFVLDEADRMLDMGFVDEVTKLSRQLPAGHQSVMFSATMNTAIRKLAETLLKDPVSIDVAPEATITDNLAHSVMMVPGHQKRDLLLHLFETEQPGKSLVFVRTRRDADELASYLEAVGFKTDAIHGDKQQKARQRTIRDFTAGLFDILVATDVAARGIDVKDITHVFNMDVPVEAESYVHRIGRTARGGAHGKAITLCGKSDMRLLKAIESCIGMSVPVDHDHPFPLSFTKSKGNFSARADSGKHRKTHKDRTPAGKRSREAAAGRPSEGRRDERPAFGKPRRAEGAGFSGKPARGGRDDRPAFGAPRREEGASFKDRPARRDDRPAFGKPRLEEGASFSDRPARRDDRPAFGRPRRAEGTDFSGKPARGGRDERPAFGKPRGEEGAGFNDRPARRDDRPAYSKPRRTEGAEFADRPARSEKTSEFKPRRDGAAVAPAKKAKGKAAGKKRPAVAARKAKDAMTKAWVTPKNRGAAKTAGGQPLRRRSN